MLRSDAKELSRLEISELQQVFKVIFGELQSVDGVCNKVLYDDKGLLVLCLFGLPFHRLMLRH